MTNFTTNTVIGLEIHVQLNTKTGLFCGCPIIPTEPNTATCPICLGHPGSKPVVNKKALEYGAKIALAIGCTIAPTITFSRKTYFYPDLAKNFQITQFELPLGSNGQLILEDGTVVRINRAHIEEDPGSLIREKESVLIDYNRSGIPLCEIVTAPDMNSPQQAREFMKKLLSVVQYLSIFNQDHGSIKADANVSIKTRNFQRVELKNITGFKEIERALQYEIERQKQQDVKRETRGWNAEKGVTYSLRDKESEEDYGYIVEPDLPLFEISHDWIKIIQKKIPELAEQRAARWVRTWKIDDADARIIANNLDVAVLFEHIAKKADPVLSSRWVRREVLRLLNDQRKELKETSFTTDSLSELFALLFDKKITDRVGQRLIEQLATRQFSPAQYVQEHNLGMVADEGALTKECETAIAQNPQAVEDYKKGEEKSLQFLIGQVMRATKGKASPPTIKTILVKLLK